MKIKIMLMSCFIVSCVSASYDKKREVYLALRTTISENLAMEIEARLRLRNNGILSLSAEASAEIVDSLYGICFGYAEASRMFYGFAKEAKLHKESIEKVEAGLQEKYQFIGAGKKRSREILD